MILSDVHRGIQKRKNRKRVGRGPGSGHGKTAGRGDKGHSAHPGHAHRFAFEGGQMPLVRRLAKRGFNNKSFSRLVAIVNLQTLEGAFDAGATVDPAALAEKGLVKGRYDAIKILGKGDPSYAVEGAALAAYARQGQKDTVAVITPWLSKSSHQDTLADAALTALGATEDPAVLDTLLGWTKPEKPRSRRAAALRGLSQLAKSKNLKNEQSQQIVKTLVAALETDDLLSRVTALRALPELGPLATSALPLLDRMAQDASRSGYKRTIKEAADRIRAESGATTTADAGELNRLREEVKRLEREHEELRKRLDRFESGKH